MQDKLQSAVKGFYKYDDFFFGITAQQAFVTRFQIENPKVLCYSDNGKLFANLREVPVDAAALHRNLQ